MPDKLLRWVGSSLEDLRAFPEAAKREGGVYEIRLHTGVEHRVFYVAKFAEAVYVLHAFEKRTRQTRQADIDLAKQRLGEVRRARGQ